MATRLRKNDPLIKFNSEYYRYPKSVYRGYWGKYMSEWNLSRKDLKRRTEWLKEVYRLSNTKFNDYCINGFSDQEDFELLLSIIESHGVYAERFFYDAIRERVIRGIAKSQIANSEFESHISDAWGRECKIFDESEIAYFISQHLYDQIILKLTKTKRFTSSVNYWLENYSQYKKCVLCDNTFRTIDIPDWIYHGSNGQKQCCFQCQILEHPYKNDLFELIPKFVDLIGFIPDSNVNPISYSFTSRIKENDFINVIRSYSKMGGIDHVETKFGSWFKALVKTGVLPDGILVTKRGIRCLAKDGHECHSLAEQKIDDWFSDHGISHDREPEYPQHDIYNLSGLKRADWKVNETFIEYFGLIGDSKYEKNMNEKIALAELSGIKLFSIYPSDLESLDERLITFMTIS